MKNSLPRKLLTLAILYHFMLAFGCSQLLAAKESECAVMLESKEHRMCGKASWYGENFRDKRTASGEKFNPDDMTAAHRTLPFGTKVKATDEKTGNSVIVRINDRGPFKEERVIDLSKAAAEMLNADIKKIGIIESVKLIIVD